MRGPEEWARRIVAVDLGVEVVHHDDGSAPSMYDLRVGSVEAPERAIEVVGAVDAVWTETWNVGPGRSAVIDLPAVAGRWTVSIEAGAIVKEIRRALPGLLADLAARGIHTVYEVEELLFFDEALGARLASLGIDYVQRVGDDLPGLVYLTMGGTGGGVIDGSGSRTPAWVGEFLRSENCVDVVEKLRQAPAVRREVFIGVTLTGAPWAVVSYLTEISRQAPVVPSEAPDLPAPIDGVWLASTHSFGEALGVRWDGSAWSTFRTRGDGITD